MITSKCICSVAALCLFFCTISKLYAQPKDTNGLLEILQKANSDSDRVVAMAKLAKAFWYVNTDSSFQYGYRSLALAQKINYAYGIGRSFNNLAVAFELKGSYTTALDFHYKALYIFDSIGNQEGISASNNNIGEIYRYSKQFDKALSFYHKSVQIDSSRGDMGELGISLNSAGQAYREMGNYTAAQQYLHRAQHALAQAGFTPGYELMQIWNDLAYTFYLQQSWDSSLIYYRRTLAVAPLLDNELQIASAKAGLASIGLHKSLKEDPLQLAMEALTIFNTHQSSLEIAQTKMLLSRIHEHRRNDHVALQWLKEANEINDTLFNDIMRRRSATLEQEYQAKKQLQDIELLKQEKALIQDKSRWQIYGLISLALVSALLLLMLFRIRKSEKEKKHLNELLIDQNKRIVKQAEALKLMGAYKTQLLSVVGHDLKGPLVSLQSMFSLVRQQHMSREEFDEIGAAISDHVGEMLLTTENLLLWARSQMDDFKVVPSVFNANTEIQNVIRLLQSTADLKAVTVNNQIHQDLSLKADVNHFRAIIRNLVSNALKYTPAKGQIFIDAQQTDKFIVFTITDTGIGIEQSLIDEFEQSNEVNSTQGLAGETGTGLGLRLCREYCLLNGGNFTLAKAADKGTKVSFTMLRA